jgi:hypothetical protein
LAGLIARFDDPEIGWAAAQADDLLPDGTRRVYQSSLPFGVVAAGAVNDWAIAHRAAWPIHPSGLTVRTQPLAVADIGTIPFRGGEKLASGWWLQDDTA